MLTITPSITMTVWPVPDVNDPLAPVPAETLPVVVTLPVTLI
jgi:hypothetical protein